MNTRLSFLAACIAGTAIFLSPSPGYSQLPVRANIISLVDNITGHTLTLAPPSPLTSDQLIVLPAMSGAGSFLMSNSIEGQALSNGLTLTGNPLGFSNTLLSIVPTIPTRTGTYYGITTHLRTGITAKGVDLIALQATVAGTGDLAIGARFSAEGTGRNTGAQFSATGGSSNTGIEVTAGGAKITGGIDNNSGGISEAGALSGITALTASGATLQSKNEATLRLQPLRMGSGDHTNIIFSDPDSKTSQIELRYTDDGSSALEVLGGSLEVGSEAEFSVTQAGAVTAESLTLAKPLAVAQGGTGVTAKGLPRNVFFATPLSGDGVPSFRKISAEDLPELSKSYIANSSAAQPSAAFNIDGSGSLGGNLIVKGSDGISLPVGSEFHPVLSFGERGADRTLQIKDGSGNILATIVDRGSTGAINANAGYQISGAAKEGTVLRGNGTDYVASVVLYPLATTQDHLLYSSADNKIASLPTSGSGVLVTTASGAPSIGNTLPLAVQRNITNVGTVTAGTWNATPLTDASIDNKLSIVGGTINATPIGSTTSSTGAFTSLSANGSVTFTSLNKAGVVHSSTTGVLTTSTITNADIAGNASIAGSKINADFGSQELRASGGLNITSGSITLGNANSTINIPGLLAIGTVSPTAMVTPNVYGGLAAGSTLNLEGSNSRTPSGDKVTITTDNTIRATLDASGMKLAGNLSFTGGRSIKPASSAGGYSLTISGGDATDRTAGAKLALQGGAGSTTGPVEINNAGGDVTIGNRGSLTAINGALSVQGGIDNNRGGITEVGALTGVTSFGASDITISSFRSSGIVHNNSRGELYSDVIDLGEDVSGVLSTESGGTGAAIVAPNLVFAGPPGGAKDGPPAFRQLTASDFPAASGSYIQNQDRSAQPAATFNIDGAGTVGGKFSVGGNAVLGNDVDDRVSVFALFNTSLNFSAGSDRSISVETAVAPLPGSSLSINAGNAGSGNGGSLSLNAGDAAGGIAGSVNINGGISATSTGGSLVVLGGTTSTGTGGSSVFAGGDASSSGNGGPTIIRGGHSKSGNSGTVSVHGGLIDGNAPADVYINTAGTTGGNVKIGNGGSMLTINTANIDISPGGAITGATGITSSGAINFGGLSTGIVKSRSGLLTSGALIVEEIPSEMSTDRELRLAISEAISGVRGGIAVFSGENSINDGDLRGDVTTSGSTRTALSETGVNAGSYGNASTVATFTVDAKGRLTNAGSATIKATASELLGATLAQSVKSSSLQSVGVVTSGTWSATPINDSYVADNLTISGGSINGTDIGTTAPRTGFFSGLTSRGVITGGGMLSLGDDDATPARGLIVLEDATGANTFDASIRTHDQLTDDRIYTLPDASGTIALVESINAAMNASVKTSLVRSDGPLTLKAKSVQVASDLMIDGALKAGKGSAPFAGKAKVTAKVEGTQRFTLKNPQAQPTSIIIVTPLTSSRGIAIPVSIDSQKTPGQFEILVNDMLIGETLEIYYLIVN